MGSELLHSDVERKRYTYSLKERENFLLDLTNRNLDDPSDKIVNLDSENEILSTFSKLIEAFDDKNKQIKKEEKTIKSKISYLEKERIKLNKNIKKRAFQRRLHWIPRYIIALFSRSFTSIKKANQTIYADIEKIDQLLNEEKSKYQWKSFMSRDSKNVLQFMRDDLKDFHKNRISLNEIKRYLMNYAELFLCCDTTNKLIDTDLTAAQQSLRLEPIVSQVNTKNNDMPPIHLARESDVFYPIETTAPLDELTSKAVEDTEVQVHTPERVRLGSVSSTLSDSSIISDGSTSGYSTTSQGAIRSSTVSLVSDNLSVIGGTNSKSLLLRLASVSSVKNDSVVQPLRSSLSELVGPALNRTLSDPTLANNSQKRDEMKASSNILAH